MVAPRSCGRAGRFPHHEHDTGYTAVLVGLARARTSILKDLLGMAHKFVRFCRAGLLQQHGEPPGVSARRGKSSERNWPCVGSVATILSQRSPGAKRNNPARNTISALT